MYEVNQGLYSNANFRSGFKFDGSQDSGVYLPVEIANEPLLGGAKLPGHYKVGFGYDTSSTYGAFSIALTATAGATSGSPISRHTGSTQSWVLFDQMLLRQGLGDSDGIIALAGFVHDDPTNSAYAKQYFAGVLDRGFWPARPQDTLGMLFTFNTVSSALGRVQSQEAALGIPLSNAASFPQTHEMVLEVNCDIHNTRGVNLQPEFQYVFRPNAQSNIHDAAVFGFEGHVEF